MMTKTETIQSLYAAFGRGDVTTILSYLADDVDWDNGRVHSRECPWNGSFKGKAQVPEFFAAVANLDLNVFNPHTYIESGNHLAVLLRIEGRVKKNGHPLANDSVHVWMFNDHGHISAYRHYNDTAMELAAWRA
jgi:uncharacterized protein